MALTQVTSAGLKDGEIVNADLHSSAAIALSKLGTSGSAGSGNFLRGDGAWTAISLDALNASNLTSGTVAAARLDTATTQSAGNNSTKIATTAYADTAVSNLVDSAPGTLNTLNELAAALGDDANFSTTVTNSIATKLPLAGGTLTGGLTLTHDIIFDNSTNAGKDWKWNRASNQIELSDDVKHVYGDGSDLLIYSDGDYGNIKANTNDLFIRSNSSGAKAIVVRSGAAVELFHNDNKKLETYGSGVKISERLWVAGGGHLYLDDASHLHIGSGDDLKIYHNGSHSRIDNDGTGNLYINAASGETGISIIKNGSIDLYYDNAKRFATTSSGCDVSGTLTIDGVAGTNTNSALNVLFQTSSGVIDGGSGLQYNPANDQLIVNGLSLTSAQVRASGNGPLHLTTANANGTVDLRVKTTEVECNGHFVPGSNNADNLGSSSLRWANLYINDLQLSNKGSSNSVDGTWGDWTLQEGEEDLFMINNRSGKKYKMALQEVS